MVMMLILLLIMIIIIIMCLHKSEGSQRKMKFCVGENYSSESSTHSDTVTCKATLTSQSALTVSIDSGEFVKKMTRESVTNSIAAMGSVSEILTTPSG